MKPLYMKPLRWPTKADKHEYMRDRQDKNIERALENRNENWLAKHFADTGHKWTREAVWGYQIFDFWCHKLGIAIESDGPEHRPDYDAYRDEYNLRRSGVLVVRIRNMNESDLKVVLQEIAAAESWAMRWERLGLNVHTKAGRRHLVTGQLSLFDDGTNNSDA